jgi:exodeoxyribonuclease-5
VAQAADAALRDFSAQRFEALSPAFIALERERLVKLVLAWLTMEVTRAQPFRVTACEQVHVLNIEGVEIRLVIDRIDTLADGRLVLMDYKTGQKPDFRNWAETRMSEPQLPVYAALSLAVEDVAAVCFGLVRTEEHGFAGIAAETDLLPGIAALDDKKGRAVFSLELFPHWQSLIAHWKTSTESIVRELKAGEAAVRFSDEKQLAYCEVLPLLRLPERQLQLERQQQEPGK